MSMQELYFTIISCIGAFLLVFFLTPAFSGFLRKKRIIGRDVNKKGMPEIPEMGGGLVVFTFLLVYLLYGIRFAADIVPLLLTVLLIALFGVFDHFFQFRPSMKLIFPFLVSFLALPMVSQNIYTPFGIFSLGYFAYFLFILSFPIVCNLTNMLAGFNGLETGLGVIMAFSLAVISFAHAGFNSFFMCLVLGSSLLAFLMYNRYPASVFPGDVLTMSIGAVLVLAAFSSGLEFYLFVLLAPYFIDAGLKFRSAGIMSREGRSPVIVSKGILYLPKGGYMSLLRLLISKKKLTEQGLVAKVINIEMFIGLMTIIMGLI